MSPELREVPLPSKPETADAMRWMLQTKLIHQRTGLADGPLGG